jgi:hypothetical protein
VITKCITAGPLAEMTKEELIEICSNLEIALSLKDQEILTINE